jgi:hypothetical protein
MSLFNGLEKKRNYSPDSNVILSLFSPDIVLVNIKQIYDSLSLLTPPSEKRKWERQEMMKKKNYSKVNSLPFTLETRIKH